MAERINKARYWWAVLYPENMVEGWEANIADTLELPFAYCIHDADHNIDGEDRKTHLHLIVAHPNTTTYNHALSVFKLLGEKAVNTCKAVINIRHAYNYLIHETDSCRDAGKFVYPEEARVLGNNFDIGAYEQIGTEEKLAMLEELVAFILDEKICNMADFMLLSNQAFGPQYFSVITGYNAMLERLCRGNYFKYESEKPSQ